MKNFWTLAFFLINCCLTAQTLPNYNFSLFETITCPFDSTKTITTYQDWLIYQTLDGSWNGVVDSTRCIGLSGVPGEGISLQDADLSRPVFVRCKLNDNNKLGLESNQIYSARAGNYTWILGIDLVTGTGCPDNLCSGLLIGIEIPDSTGAGTVIRWHTDIPDDNSLNTSYFETCVVTEYLEENYLREFIIKLTMAPGTMPDAKIKLNFASLENGYADGLLMDFVAPAWTFADTSFELPLYEAVTNPSGWNFSYILPYTDYNSWPSSAHPSFVEGTPEINADSPQTINLIVEDWETLIPQPFAYLRGALVEGSDSVRHHVNLVNNGGDLCLGFIIDFVFDGGSKYIHKGGHVSFEGRNSCFMFQNGASLEVADQAMFQYGQQGKGILLLRPGSTIRLGKNSTLLVENLLWLQGITTPEFPDPQIYMELNPGSTLAFGEHAHIFSNMNANGVTRLNIFMNGGTLDDSRLSPASRNLIHRIYPQPGSYFADNVKLMQNPVDQELGLTCISAGDETVRVEIFDLHGRSQGIQKFEAVKGYNRFGYGLEGVAAGMYVAQVIGAGGQVAVKFLKI